MTRQRQTSVVVLITLAELALLAAFGLLFAYRVKVGQVGSLRQRVADMETAAADVNRLAEDREAARRLAAELKTKLDAFSQHLGGRSPEEAIRVLKAADDADEKLRQSDRSIQALRDELARERIATLETTKVLKANGDALTELQRKLGSMPADAPRLARMHREALDQLESAGTQITSLSNRVAQLELGEVAIRRELIGLPHTELRRVIFIVDTSSSMRNSPAWQEARSIMRMWIEHLSVQECALVNFNDSATVFPSEGYQRIREAGGRVLAEKKATLLAAFDRANPGTFSDLLKGLRLAYSLPNPDLIVLLTDGHPHVAAQTDKSYGQAILREVSRHPKVPILAVAVGSYEVEGAGGPAEHRNAAISFLKTLARANGEGGFIGR
jgi:hypothetical protein